MSEREINLELYPSNWLYNAGVIGFLRVLEWGLDDKKFKEIISNFFKKHILVLPGKVFDKTQFTYDKAEYELNQILSWYFSLSRNQRKGNKNDLPLGELIKEEWGYKFNQEFRGLFNAGIFGKGNTVQKRKEFDKINNLSHLALKNTTNKSGIHKCVICGKNFTKESDFDKFYIFSSQHMKALGSSPEEKGMPNSFWNLESSMPICLTCTYMIFHYPLAFTRTSDGEIFINAPDFKLMWYLNKFVREVAGKESDTRRLFGLSLMNWAIRMNQTLGAWTMANIEVIRKKGNTIDHFDLPSDVVKILMDPTSASILSRLSLWPILESVMREKYSELLVATYCAAKACLADNIPKNHCVKKYGGRKDNASDMFSLLPRLFVRIKGIIKKEDEMRDKRSIVEKLKEDGQSNKDLKESFKNMVLKILELTRLGKINDAYQAIVRIFIAARKPIPSSLVNILSEEDQEIQKAYIYAFLSGILGDGQNKGGE